MAPALAAGQSGPPSRSDRARSGEASSADRVDFSYQIRPLLSDRCFRCHGPDPGKRKAKLRLDTREGVLKELEEARAGRSSSRATRARASSSGASSRTTTTTGCRRRSRTCRCRRRKRRCSSAGSSRAPTTGRTGRSCRSTRSACPTLACGGPRRRNPIDAFVRARLDAGRAHAGAAGVTRDRSSAASRST